MNYTNPFIPPILFKLLVILFLVIEIACCEWESQTSDIRENHLQGIINGEETNYERWKGVIGLNIPGEYMDYICTGTLIDPQVVLTAGHCVYNPDEGIDVLSSSTSDVEILGGADMEIYYASASRIIKHEDWNGNIYEAWHVDLAMILLDEPITEVEYYGITAVPLELRQEGVVVGYGNNTNFGGEKVHRDGETTVIELPIGDRIFEIGHPSGTCRGDSGGPFFTKEKDKWVVAGVTSYGSGTQCLTHEGNWDVRVYTYREWIDRTMHHLTGHGLTLDSDTTDNPQGQDTESRVTPFGMDSPNPVECRFSSGSRPMRLRFFHLLQSIF